jgi:hypothetical protein
MRHCLLLLSFALLSGCVSNQPRHVPRPGYECSVGRMDDGEYISWRLEEDGRQIDASMHWTSRAGQQPKVSVSMLTSAAEPLRLEDASANIHWDPPLNILPRGPRLRLRMDLATEAKASPWREEKFISNYSGEYRLEGKLVDLAAFARNQSELFLVVRDRNGRIFAHTALDSTVFEQALSASKAMLAGMSEVNAAYRSRCRFTNDIDPYIVLT